MLLALFSSYIRILTSFQRLLWGLVFFIILSLFVLASFFLFKKRFSRHFPRFSLKKFFGFQLLSLFLATVAVGIKLWSFDPVLLPYFFSFEKIVNADALATLSISSAKVSLKNPSTTSKYQSVLGYYQLDEQTKPDTYVIRDESGTAFFFKSDQDLQLGSSIYLAGSLLPVNYQNTFSELLFSSPGGEGMDSDNGFRGGWGRFFDYQFNYDKWLMMKGFHGTIYPQLLVVDPLEAPVFSESRFTQLLRQWRVQIKNIVVQALPDQNGALLLGMMIGDRSLLPQDQYQNFVESGLVHIIAVSGGNIVMIVVFLSLVFFFFPFYLRNVLIILGITLFALLCGGDSSIIRALIMALLSLLALFRGREIAIWRLMAYAFFLMLLYNPFFLSYDLGFLLSFAALVGIVLFSQMWDARKNVEKSSKTLPQNNKLQQALNKRSKEYLLPTVGATLGTLPILIFFIGTSNFSGVLANLLIVPLVPLITIGGFLGALVFSMTGWVWILWPLNLLLSLFYKISDLANHYRFAIQLDTLREKYLFVAMMLYFFRIIFASAKYFAQKSLKNQKQ